MSEVAGLIGIPIDTWFHFFMILTVTIFAMFEIVIVVGTIFMRQVGAIAIGLGTILVGAMCSSWVAGVVCLYKGL